MRLAGFCLTQKDVTGQNLRTSGQAGSRGLKETAGTMTVPAGKD